MSESIQPESASDSPLVDQTPAHSSPPADSERVDEGPSTSPVIAPVPARLPALSRRAFLLNAATAVVALTGGIGIGFWTWGLPSVREKTTEPAAPLPDAAVTSGPLALPESHTFAIRYGAIGPQLVKAGAIDFDAMAQLYQQGGAALSESQRDLLLNGSEAPVSFDMSSARFLLNLFWAVGLANNNPILRTGTMVTKGQGKIDGYASTGGWTLANAPLHAIYSSSALAVLNSEQQGRLEEAAGIIYRPCCNNPTSFPDCNHGMAMLGLLEMMAAQDATVDEMLEAAKIINRFWFPEQTAHLALYYQAQGVQSFEAIPAREAVGIERFSGTGYQQVRTWLAGNGLPEAPGQGSNNCAV